MKFNKKLSADQVREIIKQADEHSRKIRVGEIMPYTKRVPDKGDTTFSIETGYFCAKTNKRIKNRDYAHTQTIKEIEDETTKMAAKIREEIVDVKQADLLNCVVRQLDVEMVVDGNCFSKENEAQQFLNNLTLDNINKYFWEPLEKLNNKSKTADIIRIMSRCQTKKEIKNNIVDFGLNSYNLLIIDSTIHAIEQWRCVENAEFLNKWLINHSVYLMAVGNYLFEYAQQVIKDLTES